MAFTYITSALAHLGHYGPLTEVLEVSTRSRGRPPKNPAEGEVFRFLTISQSTSAVHRLLLRLKRDHPVAFEAVCSGFMTPRQAARSVGLIPERPGVSRLLRLSERERFGGVISLWDSLPVSAQSEFLAQIIEPALGLYELADRWRQQKDPAGPR
jgi:hypothetical protein